MGWRYYATCSDLLAVQSALLDLDAVYDGKMLIFRLHPRAIAVGQPSNLRASAFKQQR